MCKNDKRKRSSGPGASGSNAGDHRPTASESVVWSDKMSEYLIDALLRQQEIGNRGESRFLTVALDSVITGVGERFGVTIDRSNIKSRLKHIKKSFHECENLFEKESGFKWSAVTKMFCAEPHVWREIIERKPEAKRWMTKTIDHYDKLLQLFGNDRERCIGSTAAGNPKGAPAKRARKDPPKEKPQLKPSNGLELPIVKSLKEMMNENEVPSEVVTENNIAEEYDLSEKYKSENGLLAMPVPGNACGKGLPYAPDNWPCPGDQWGWKVGCRAAATGHWVDRYLTPPSRFCDATGKKISFKSRLKVEEFIKTEFPDVDPSTFFSMFIWKIPAEGHIIQRGTQQVRLHEPKCGLADPAGPCKARNNLCKLEREGFIESSPAHDCVICSRKPGFCRECCCVFCRRVVDYSFGGYSYIKCEAVLEENYICGHVGHLECAHRNFMAGTVGGVFDLDVQYLCRLCDNKTNLMMHVEELLETCKSLQSRDEIEPILNTGLYLLRGSGQMRARSLAKFMRSAMAKLKRGVDLAEVWKMGDNDEVSTEEDDPPGPPYYFGRSENPLHRAIENLPPFIFEDYDVMATRLEGQIEEALKKLKSTQEAEYMLAKQKLYSQKDYIVSLHRQENHERSVIRAHMPMPFPDSSPYDIHLSNLVKLVDQVKREEEKFKAMLEAAAKGS